MGESNYLIGQRAEQKACDFLQQQGLRLIFRNYHNRHGEIDLIMQDGNDIVFIEVRARARNQYGSAIESIDTKKQYKLIKTAAYYLQYFYKAEEINCRFDVIGISPHEKIEWIKDAFSTDMSYCL